MHDQFEAVTDHLCVEPVEDGIGRGLSADLSNSAMELLVEIGVAESVARVYALIIPSRKC